MQKGSGCHQMGPCIEDDKEKIVHQHRTVDSYPAFSFQTMALSLKNTLSLAL